MSADVAVTVWVLLVDVSVSLAVLVGVVVVSDVLRRFLARALADTGLCGYAAELVSTLQLCCCTLELKLLSAAGRLSPGPALLLTYLGSVVHGLTFRGAAGNPSGVLEHAYRRRLTPAAALRRIACQFAAAAAARFVLVPALWGLGVSSLHAQTRRLGFPCGSPVRGSVCAAAAVEAACAFAVQTVSTHTQGVEEKYRVHAVAAVIATVVYAGGQMTGAVFNPALAFSTQFPCSGTSFLENCFIYWLGPLLGMMSSVLLFDKLVALLSGQPLPLHLPLESKKKI
ncbi:aquaporin-11 [Cololabis saira]|uniref:aquaporin-11 n=1 Tax=Cololabis saira TaxID=129043 RepID=UPI002AD364A1|nr:aquaporin-11 [Cololabis saira]